MQKSVPNTLKMSKALPLFIALIFYSSISPVILHAEVHATPVEIGNTTARVLVGNVKEWSNCEPKGSQLIDVAHDGSYIEFDIKATNSGYYTFTSAIATSLNDIGCTLGYLGNSGNFEESKKLDIDNSGSWTSTKDYKWNFYLEAGVTYPFKMMCHAASGYALNAFTIRIDAFVADVSLSGMKVNEFDVVPMDGIYTSDVYFDKDMQVRVTANATTALVTYSAKVNDTGVAITADGSISKDLLNIGDEIRVTATISDGPSASQDYPLTIFVTDHLKKQIRGTTSNDGVFTKVASSSAVQYWTDYMYTLTPDATSVRFSSGTWRQSGEETHYVFYAKSAEVNIETPTFFHIKAVTLVGYGPANFELSSEGATVTASKSGFKDASSANNLDQISFNLSQHTPGKPLQLTIGDENCRFYLVLHYQEVADVSAPFLVAQNLQEAAEISSINSQVSLRFNEGIKLSETANATLNGEKVEIKVEDNVFVNHNFWGLNYDDTYTYILKANSVEDMSGNKNQEDIEINFSVGSKPILVKKEFDFVIGVDGSADEAFAAANAYRGRARYYIFVPNGSYELSGNSADHMTNLNKSNVSIIGQSMENAILFNNPESYGISSTATIHLNNSGNGYFEDLTVKNNSGAPTGGQQVAIFDRGARNIFKHVKFFSWQDTYVSGDQGYHEDCEIYGSVDFICGGGDQFFMNCLLYNNGASGNKVTAPATDIGKKWGYVFYNCTIDGGRFVLGRPWQGEPRANYLYTKMHRQPDGNGYEGMGGLTTHFYEYKSTDYSGELLDLSSRGNSPTSTNSYKPILTDVEAATFTLPNVLGGTDGWLPSDYTKQTKAPELLVNGAVLSWINDPDALCTFIFKDGIYFTNTSENEAILEENGTYTVQFANEQGGLGEATTVEVISTSVDEIFKNEAHRSRKGIFDQLGRPLQQIPEEGFYILDGKKHYKIHN